MEFDDPFGYRNKRSEPEQFTQVLINDDTAVAVASWCGGLVVQEHDAIEYESVSLGVNVPTNRGVQRASHGDWVILQEDGSFEVMGPADYQRSRSS